VLDQRILNLNRGGLALDSVSVPDATGRNNSRRSAGLATRHSCHLGSRIRLIVGILILLLQYHLEVFPCDLAQS
jgi:hypothetical protein